MKNFITIATQKDSRTALNPDEVLAITRKGEELTVEMKQGVHHVFSNAALEINARKTSVGRDEAQVLKNQGYVAVTTDTGTTYLNASQIVKIHASGEQEDASADVLWKDGDTHFLITHPQNLNDAFKSWVEGKSNTGRIYVNPDCIVSTTKKGDVARIAVNSLPGATTGDHAASYEISPAAFNALTPGFLPLKGSDRHLNPTHVGEFTQDEDDGNTRLSLIGSDTSEGICPLSFLEISRRIQTANAQSRTGGSYALA